MKEINTREFFDENLDEEGRERGKQPRGRPSVHGPDKRVITVGMSKEQAEAGSRKSKKGRVFNRSDFLRLCDKYYFLGVSLPVAQRHYRELLTREEKERANGGGK